MFSVDTSVNDYASLVVTHKCNRCCPFCVDAYRGNAEYIYIPLVQKAIGVFKQKNIKDVLIVGGEPTLHPNIVDICKAIKDAGFNTILTTNFSLPDIVFNIDGIVDCLNVSYYAQKMLPCQSDMVTDLTISALIHAKQFETKEKLDRFIDKYYSTAHLKFSTLSMCNQWTKQNQKVPYLNDLCADRVVLFDEIEGLVYRGCVIKRYDKVLNKNANQSLKFHVDGEVSYSWKRRAPSVAQEPPQDKGRPQKQQLTAQACKPEEPASTH